MQEGKVYRVVDRFEGDDSVKKHGWLWVLVKSDIDAFEEKVGLFRSVATGYEGAIAYSKMKELSDARG